MTALPHEPPPDPFMDAYNALPPPGPPNMRTRQILEDARQAVDHDPIIQAGQTAERRYWNELHKAMRLSGGSLEVCEALLRGEPVPRTRLDPQWAKAYGIR